MQSNFIIDDFNDINTTQGIDSTLTESMPSTPWIHNWKPLTQTCTPIACTWTYPLDKKHEDWICKNHDDKYNLSRQCERMIPDLEKWLKKCSNIIIKKELLRIEVYFELTKNKLIHAHGILYYDNMGLYNSFYLLMSTAWARTSGGTVKAMSKYNPTNGKTDYAFDKCNNVENWKKYIRKECSDDTNFHEDTTELAKKLDKKKKESQRQLKLLDQNIEINF